MEANLGHTQGRWPNNAPVRPLCVLRTAWSDRFAIDHRYTSTPRHSYVGVTTTANESHSNVMPQLNQTQCSMSFTPRGMEDFIHDIFDNMLVNIVLSATSKRSQRLRASSCRA